MVNGFRGPPRFEGDRPRFGDRDGYRGGPRGGGDFASDKGGAPAEFQPSFRVSAFVMKYLRLLLIIGSLAFKICNSWGSNGFLSQSDLFKLVYLLWL